MQRALGTGGSHVIAALFLALILLLPTLAGAQAAVTVITPAQGTTAKAAPTATQADANHTGFDVNIAGATLSPNAPVPVLATPAPSLPPPACNPLLKAAAQPCR